MARYVIVNLNGKSWNGKRWSSWSAKEFYSKGSVIACMRMLKRYGYKCYYERV
jgi:hypothetical protein